MSERPDNISPATWHPRAFISYAHEPDSDTHRLAVWQLYVLLRTCGVDARVDLVAAEKRRDWALWTAEQIRAADYVLVVASPAYRVRAQGQADANDGRGVQWEARLIRDAHYNDPHGLNRFVPVVLPNQTVDGVPDFFAPATSTVYHVKDFTVPGAEALLRLLTGQPAHIEPILGPLVVLPSYQPTEPGPGASDRIAGEPTLPTEAVALDTRTPAHDMSGPGPLTGEGRVTVDPRSGFENPAYPALPVTMEGPPPPDDLSGDPSETPQDGQRRSRRLRGWPIPAALAGVVVLVVVLVTTWPATRNSGPQPAAFALLPVCTAATVTVQIAVSTDKSDEMAQFAKDYGARSDHGQCVGIGVQSLDSGVAMTDLTRGWTAKDGQRPDVWSPASSTWLTLAHVRASTTTAQLFPTTAPASVVSSPLTIAMPAPMAQALGWPGHQIGWQDLATFANTTDFWADHHHPEWGSFRLGKTNPYLSTSGLNATLAAFFAATGRSDTLTGADVLNKNYQNVVRSIEDSVVHYGDTTLTFLDNLRTLDDTSRHDEDSATPDPALSYVSAVTLEESAVVAYNRGYKCGAINSQQSGCAVLNTPPHTKLDAFYPDDGTLFSDHPYIELNGMDQTKKAVADNFLGYLHSSDVQAKFAQYGFRTYLDQPTTYIKNAYGAISDAAIHPMPLPRPDVLNQVLSTWQNVRKPARVLLVIDTSGSMNECVRGTKSPPHPDCETDDGSPPSGQSKLELVQAAMPSLLTGFTKPDQLGLWQFSSREAQDGTHSYRQRVPIQAMTGAQPAAVKAAVDQLVPAGNTGLYSAIEAAVRALRTHYDANAINAVIVLTDGYDTGSTPPVDLDTDLLPFLRADPAQPVRVFTIAYGAVADRPDPDTPPQPGSSTETVLAKIAKVSGAGEYLATKPTAIQSMLTAVISNF